MTDTELIDWIKKLDNLDNMPADTNQRMTRILKLLVNKAYPTKPGRKPTLHLNKAS